MCVALRRQRHWIHSKALSLATRRLAVALLSDGAATDVRCMISLLSVVEFTPLGHVRKNMFAHRV